METQPLIQKEYQNSPLSPQKQMILPTISSVISLVGFIVSLYYYVYAKVNQCISFSFGQPEDGKTYVIIFPIFIVLFILSLFLSIQPFIDKKLKLKQNLHILLSSILTTISSVLMIVLICAVSIKPQQLVYSYYSTDQGFKLNYYTVKNQKTDVKIDYLNGTIDNYIDESKQHWHEVDIQTQDDILLTILYNSNQQEQNIELNNDIIQQHQFYMSSDTSTDKQLQQEIEDVPMEKNFYLYIPTQQLDKQHQLINYYNQLLHPNTHFMYISNITETHMEKINGDYFYFINLDEFDDLSALYEYLDTQIPKYQGIKYLVLNKIIMSAGPSGINNDIAEVILSVIERYTTQQVAAVVQPSDGCLSVFKFSNTYIISVGRGQYEAKVNDSSIMNDRTWNSQELQGPLDLLNISYMYSLHQFSNIQQQFLKFQVIENNSVEIQALDLQQQEVQYNTTSNTEFIYQWGPVMTPYEDGANISWYTKEKTVGSLCINQKLYYGDNNLFNTQDADTCEVLFNNESLKQNYHSLYIPLNKFNFTLNGKQMTFDNTERSVHKFLVTLDLHEDFFIGRKTERTASNFDFHIFAGDFSYLSDDLEYSMCYNSYIAENEIFLPVDGNHDGFAHHYQVQRHEKNESYQIPGVERRNTSFYQNVQGVNFFGLFIFNSTYITNESEVIMNQTLEFLEEELYKHDGVKFIITHRPMYSTGDFGANQTYSQRLENIIKIYNDQQNDSNNRVLAVFSGHDHIFSSFYNQDLKLWSFVDASDGGVLSLVNLRITLKDRNWKGNNKLHGDLSEEYGDTGLCYGYNWHVDSYRQFTQTEVYLDEEKKHMTVQVRDLINDVIVYQYDWDY